MTAVPGYGDFLAAKAVLAEQCGVQIAPGAVNPLLKPHQRDIVRWAVQGGRRAIFAAFGLGKTLMQLESVRLTLAHLGGGRGLIVMPLGVRQEFRRDAHTLRTGDHPDITAMQRDDLASWQAAGADRVLPPVTFVRTTGEADAPGIYLTNYESVRDGRLDPSGFDVLSLDEAGILRGFGGTKTFRELMRLFEGRGTYRFVATATPSPNDYIELLAYAAFLDIMDVGQAKTRFFRRDSTQADRLTLHPHKEREFWLWVASWALFIERPSDLGHSDEGYELPALEVHWHEVPTDHAEAGADSRGQHRLLADAAIGVQDAAREKRRSLDARVAKMMELRAEDPDAHRVLWHDLEAERHAIEEAVPDVVSVYGSQDLDEREEAIVAFSEGWVRELAGKPVMLGAGVNFQRHCWWAIFLGIGFKFADFIQAIHRLRRYLQTHKVRIDLIYTEAEREVRRQLERKWRQHDELVARMTAIIREHGLARAATEVALVRSIKVERREASGRGWRVVLNDSVEETAAMEADSVGLVLTSIPFSTQYEYTPSYRDFGHTDDNEHFWRQMDYLTPELLRVLQPGRILAVHCKDRIAPGGLTGLGYQTVQPFHAEAIRHYTGHSFGYLGMKTIVTDVVRENNQTYRLGWSEQCKDGSRMGCGMPEYLLILRKSPTDRSNGYADVPVVKSKTEYSLGRWQVDAHGFMRSSGDRLLQPADLEGIPHDRIYKLFRRWSTEEVYDYEHHVRLAEQLQQRGLLPVTFMLLPPASWHPDVWADVARMRTLNMVQAAKGRAMHLCPLQFDIVDRAIRQYTMPGEVVYDPFGGIMTVPRQAVKLGRVGWACELNEGYWMDGVTYLEAVEQEVATPSLFDLLATPEEAAPAEELTG